MTHPSHDILDAFAYDMLEEEASRLVAHHVARCPRCRALYEARCTEALHVESALAGAPLRNASRWLPWVAAAAVLLAVSSFSWRSGPTPEPIPGSQVTDVDVVPRGLHRLSDGSLVHASASIEVLGWREVAIEAGDYFFDVAPRPDMPFLVRTPAGLVKVVGTKFRLFVERTPMNTKSAALLAVAVVSGAVIVSNSQGTLDVQPGQEVVVEEGSAPRRVGENPALRPVLVSPSPQQHMARLESELREAQQQIAALQQKMGGKAPALESDLSDPRVLAKAQARFFELKKAYVSGAASEEQLAELIKLSKSKEIMGFIVKGLEKQIADEPDDLDARLQLANVESSRVHMAESITERAVLGRNVREQIREVLKREPENWEARFMQAVGTSHSQRTPQGRANAIGQFESLLALQGAQSPEPRFAQTYAQLAVVYMAERDTQKARETIREGLAAYPDAKDLKNLMGRLSTSGK